MAGGGSIDGGITIGMGILLGHGGGGAVMGMGGGGPPVMIGPPGQSAPDDPTLTGLTAFMDADVGITLGAGDVVTAWADQSGNANHMEQTVGGWEPNGINTAEIDGRDTIALTGGRFLKWAPALDQAGEFDAWLIFRLDAAHGSCILMGRASGDGLIAMSSGEQLQAGDTSMSVISTVNACTPDNVFYAVRVIRNASNEFHCWVNGVDVTLVTPHVDAGSIDVDDIPSQNQSITGSVAMALLYSGTNLSVGAARVTWRYLEGQFPSIGITP